tara:strand:+ start:39 stop:254 length:216 start_codon:yes stop_codon:yes gene_type:complete
MLNKKLINKRKQTMLNEIVIYMKDEQIEINETNYKLELLNFIAEHTLNDLDNRKYIDEAVKLLIEERYENS